MKIEARAMTIDEYEAYLNKVEEVTTSKDKGHNLKNLFSLAKYVAETIYGIDLKKTKVTPGTLYDLYEKTNKLTEASELEDEKN